MEIPEFLLEMSNQMNNEDNRMTSDPIWQVRCKRYIPQETEEVVSTHLTEQDANWFIKRKQHDYPTLYTYVESAYWAPQLKELRTWVLSLAVADA